MAPARMARTTDWSWSLTLERMTTLVFGSRAWIRCVTRDSVQVRQKQVGEHDVRQEFVGERDAGCAGVRLTHDFKVGLCVEDASQAAPNDWMVVDQHNS